MHLRRAAQAPSPSFAPPPAIRNGNWVRNFSAKTYCDRCDPKCSSQTSAGWNLAGFFRIAISSLVFHWAVFLFVVVGITPSWAQVPGTLQNVRLIPKNDTAGVGITYELSFQAPNGLPSNGRILIYFPDVPNGFDISGVLVASNVKNLTGGYIITRDLQNLIVTLERDGTGTPLAPNDSATIKFAIVGNPTKAGLYTFTRIVTQDDDGDLDEANGIGVTIKAGALDHFNFTTIGNQIADKDIPAFTITAKDAYDNNVALGDSVFLFDNTGTLTPKKVVIGASQSSVTVNNARISKGQQNVVIAARAKTTEKIGMSNAFNVNQIKILNIDAIPTTVSRGQQGLEVNMTVLNGGPNDVTLIDAQLSFERNGNPVDGQYTVTPQLPFPTIPGDFSTKTLRFLVAISSGAMTGQIDIDGSVTGSIPGVAGTLSDTDADSADSWIVQLRPRLSYANGLFPKQVTPGGFFEFQVPIKNIIGAAKLELKPDSTTFTFNDADDIFTARLDANRGTQLVGKNTATTLTFRRSQIPINMQQTSYAPRIRLIGTHNGARLDTSFTLTEQLLVGQASPLQIMEVFSSQDNVTQGMDKDWTISLRVQNNTSTPVNLNSTELSLVKLGTGGGPDTDYQIVKPARFKKSGGTLAATAIDTLVFQITKIGRVTGPLAVFARVFVNELPNNPAESNGTQKSILVQTPADLSIALQVSQDSVTQGQTHPWQVFMKVKNKGESSVKVRFENVDPAKVTRISLSSQVNYIVEPRSTDITIQGKDSTTSIVFDVKKTGSVSLQPLPIDGQIYAREINSDSVHFASIESGDSITVQRKANVRIENVELAEVYNGDSVNVDQPFKVRVKVQQTVTGAEKVDSVHVQLTATGQGTVDIPKAIRTLADLTEWLYFDVIANSAGSVEFIASITEAYSANTGANTVSSNNNGAPKPEAVIQRPGKLQIGPITTSEDTVSIRRSTPWDIFVPVQNTEEGTLVITSSQVTVTIGGELQNDYKINSPPGTRTLAAGQTTTLIYNVTQTGYTGGTATLTAILNVLDKNSNTTSEKSGAGTIAVESSALVKILDTGFPATANRVPESQIALVDTGQVFDIEVTVENTGLEVVDTAYVSLTNPNGNSQLLNTRAKAAEIATNGSTAKAIFKVRAAGATNPLGETFIARLDSAVTDIGNAKAALGPPVDSTAVARIELPARLQLQVVTDNGDSTVGFGQQFKIRARVKNLGQARTDGSGVLEIIRPSNYAFVGNESAAKSFAVGDSVEWRVRAPQQESRLDTFIVTVENLPIDNNSGQPAAAFNTEAELVISTLQTTLNVAATYVTAPDGAMDRIISTEQFFIVGAEISASNNLTDKTATLSLPAGYSFGSRQDPTKSVPVDGKVTWEVQAPTDAAPGSVNLNLKVEAKDDQSQPRESNATIAITAKRRAILNLTPGISEPAGARDGVLSVGQAFTLSAILANTGEANLSDTVTVELNLGDTEISVSPSLIKRTVVFTSDSQVKTITWPAVAPNQQTDAFDLSFKIVRLPLDENTNKAATLVTNPVYFKVTTIDRGSLAASNLRIKSPTGAQDNILSTEQDFVVSVALNWTNAINVSARLSMPSSFTTESTTKSLTNILESGNDTLSWKISAPLSAVTSADLKVYVEASDAHDNSVTLKDSSGVLPIRVEERADPQLRVFISNPPAATDGVVSVGQPFEVTAVIQNNGTAALTRSATVSVDSTFFRDSGYALLAPLNPAIISSNLTFTWRIRARQDISIETDLIPFKLQAAPFDTNTNQRASSTLSQISLAVRTESKKLVVEAVEKGGGPAFRGDKDLPLLRLKLTNPAGIGSSNLALKKITFDLQERDRTPVAAKTALKAIRIVNEARRDTLYGEIKDISAIIVSALVVELAKYVVVTSAKPETLTVLGDVAENATARHFRMVFDHGQDFTAADQDGGNGVVIESNDGKRGSNFRLESNLVVLFDSEPQKSFYNYPNPLKPGNNKARGEGTHFTYNLPEASAGELKVFTLLGELVWETSFSAADPAGAKGGHKLDLFWNGYNGANRKILNGVYIALLKTAKYGTFMTKVAVVK